MSLPGQRIKGTIGRNVNAELKQFLAKKAWSRKMEKKYYKFVKCSECGKRIPHDFNLIQRHYLDFHKITDNREKKSQGWKFSPVKEIKNPLNVDRASVFGLRL